MSGLAQAVTLIGELIRPEVTHDKRDTILLFLQRLRCAKRIRSTLDYRAMEIAKKYRGYVRAAGNYGTATWRSDETDPGKNDTRGNKSRYRARESVAPDAPESIRSFFFLPEESGRSVFLRNA